MMNKGKEGERKEEKKEKRKTEGGKEEMQEEKPGRLLCLCVYTYI